MGVSPPLKVNVIILDFLQKNNTFAKLTLSKNSLAINVRFVRG